MKAPCKDCPGRTAICHDTCPKYQAFRREREEINQKRREYQIGYKHRQKWEPKKINGDQ